MLSVLLIYFLTSSRIDPFRFQAGGRRRQTNLALFFGSFYIVVYFVTDTYFLFVVF